MAKDLENTYLVLEAIENNTQPTTSSTAAPPTFASNEGAAVTFQRQQLPSSSSLPFGYRSSNVSSYYPRNSSFTNVPRASAASQPSVFSETILSPHWSWIQ